MGKTALHGIHRVVGYTGDTGICEIHLTCLAVPCALSRLQTALHKAAWFGYRGICCILVDAGASLQRHDHQVREGRSLTMLEQLVFECCALLFRATLHTISQFKVETFNCKTI